MFHHTLTPLISHPGLTEKGSAALMELHTAMFMAGKAELFFSSRELEMLNQHILTTLRGDEDPGLLWKAMNYTSLAIALTMTGELDQAFNPIDAKPFTSENLMQLFAIAHDAVHKAEWPDDINQAEECCEATSQGYVHCWLNSKLEAMPQATEPPPKFSLN